VIEEVTNQQHQSDQSHHHAYAFPQDQFRLPFTFEQGNSHHDGERNAEWIFRNKVIPGLSGFITLEDFSHPEDEMRAAEFNKIDVDDLVHGDMNFNLNKFFEETEGRKQNDYHSRKMTPVNEPVQANHINVPQNEPIQANKMSFFKEFLPNMFNHHWADVVSNPTHFLEFESDFPVVKNIENLLYLEDHKKECGDNFESLFSNSYKEIIEKIRSLFSSNRLTAEGLIKLIHDSACNLLYNVFNFIKGCDSEYCFNLMKQQTAMAKLKIAKQELTKKPEPVFSPQLQNFLVPPSKPIIEENKKVDTTMTNETSDFNNFDFVRREEIRSVASQQTDVSETDSVLSESTKKTQRKYWSDKELEELDRLYAQYYPNSIPTERLEEFARKYGRTLNSVQSKISKTKKGRSSRKSPEMENETSATPPASQRKYEIGLEKMICTALKHIPGGTASKPEILDKIRALFANGQSYFNEESFENSVSQILSSSKNIQKIKGTYGLRSPRYAIHDISHANTTRTRLQYVLAQLPNFRGDIGTIRKYYWEYFQDVLKNDKERLWETTVVKILKQSDEFDSNDSKTKYKLIRDSP